MERDKKKKEEEEVEAVSTTEPARLTLAEYADQCGLQTLLEELIPTKTMPSNPYSAMARVLTVKRCAPIRKVEALWRCDAVATMTLIVQASTDTATVASSWLSGEGLQSPEAEALINSAGGAALTYRNCTDLAAMDKLVVSHPELAGANDSRLTMLLSSVVCKLGAATLDLPLFQHIAAALGGDGSPSVVEALPVPVLAFAAPYYVTCNGPWRTFAPCVEVLARVYHEACRSLEVTDAFSADDGRSVPPQCVSMTTDRTFTPDDLRASLLAAMAGLGCRLALGKQCGAKDSAVALVGDAVFSAIDCPGPIPRRASGERDRGVCSLLDRALYAPPLERRPITRLPAVADGGYCGVVLRPECFTCTTEVLDFVRAVRKNTNPRLAIVVDTTAATANAMDEQPMFLSHLACGIGADAVLLPVPTSSQSTAIYNELLRIEERVIEQCRRYQFATPPTPWLCPP